MRQASQIGTWIVIFCLPFLGAFSCASSGQLFVKERDTTTTHPSGAKIARRSFPEVVGVVDEWAKRRGIRKRPNGTYVADFDRCGVLGCSSDYVLITIRTIDNNNATAIEFTDFNAWRSTQSRELERELHSVLTDAFGKHAVGQGAP